MLGRRLIHAASNATITTNATQAPCLIRRPLSSWSGDSSGNRKNRQRNRGDGDEHGDFGLRPLQMDRQRHLTRNHSTLEVTSANDTYGSNSDAAPTTMTIRHQRPIYVAATRQHVGKTSVSLALVSHFTKRFGTENVGYMKAVGQQQQRVWDSTNSENDDSQEGGRYVVIDKDVKLIRDHFRLFHLQYADMSPILIPRGYTKKYLDGNIDHASQMADIRRAYLNIVKSSTTVAQPTQQQQQHITICEGTGHAGVGSVVGAGNARVAAELGADVVLVANGGLGKAFDELELNRSLCLVRAILKFFIFS